MRDRYSPAKPVAHSRGRGRPAPCRDHPRAPLVPDFEAAGEGVPLVCAGCLRNRPPEPQVVEADRARAERWAAAEADPDTAYTGRRVDQPRRLYEKRRRRPNPTP